MTKNKNRILVIAAHPDDEVLGCGGTIAKYVKSGSKVFCLLLGKGKSSRRKSNLEKEQALLRKEAQRSVKILGISKIFFENFPDQRYDKVPLLKIIKAIEKIKEEIKPDIVFTHHFGDLNKDHRITYEAVMTAFRPLPGETAREIYSFEIPSSTEWGFPKRKTYFVPNVFVDISNTFYRKINALKSYKIEIRKFPHPRSSEGVKILAQKRGMEVGLNYAEAFELIRGIKKGS